MEINQLNEGQMIDLFATPGENSQELANNSNLPKFGHQEQINLDIFNNGQQGNQAPEGNQDLPAATDTTTTLAPELDENGNPKTNIDILNLEGGDDKTTKGRKPKYDFSDASGYFEDRFKSGKFVAIEEELADGTKQPFIPKSPEEFDEVIDLQVNWKLEEERKDLEKKIIESKSPAWQASLRYAEVVDNPADLIPFLQGVQTIQRVSEIDTTQIEGAEKLLRLSLEGKGISEDVIDTQVESLKTTDKLIATAEKIKPAMLAEESRNLAAMQQKAEAERNNYMKMVSEIRTQAVAEIEKPLFGKHKLKKEEMMVVYDLIAEPSPETNGYPIFNAIDELYEKKDFDTLRQIALLLGKKDSFLNYISITASDRTSGTLQRKLITTTANRGGGNSSTEEPAKPVINRNSYNSGGSPKFGRG